jgi:uncharacterized protein YcnI
MLLAREVRWARRAGRVTVILAGVAVATLAWTGTALAHITVTPTSAAQGSAAELTFKVPNEEAKADTIEVQLQVPTAHPIAQLLVKPVPGWTITVQNVRLAKPVVTDDGSFSAAVSEVTWTGGKIIPGEYQDFSVSADPLPSGVSHLVFKAVQTYSNGDVVRWIDLPQPGEPAPGHPAPVLTLTAPGAAVATAARGALARAGGGNGDQAGLAVGAAGLAAGLLGLAAGLYAVRRGRRSVRP